MREQRLYGKLNKEIQKGILTSLDVTPTAEGETITPEKGYDGFSSVTVPAEPNLIPGNIVEGKNIYGVEGTAIELYKDENLTPENLREGVTVYEGTVAETTGTLYVPTIDAKAWIEGENFSVDDDTITKVQDYVFQNVVGLQSFKSFGLTKIGEYAFSNARSKTNTLKISLKINGIVGRSSISNRYVSEFYLDPESNITGLDVSCFSYLGSSRLNPENNIFILDLRNSTFPYAESNSFAYLVYTNIYLPKTVQGIYSQSFTSSRNVNVYIPQKEDLVQMYYSGAFSGSTNTTIYVPNSQLEAYKSATNWSAVANLMVGYDPESV